MRTKKKPFIGDVIYIHGVGYVWRRLYSGWNSPNTFSLAAAKAQFPGIKIEGNINEN